MNAIEEAREEGRRLGHAEAEAQTYKEANAKVDHRLLRGGAGSVPGRVSDGPMAYGGEASNSGCSRMPAREALRQRAFELHRKAVQLESLASSIPDNFPSEAENALWDLATNIRVY